MKCKILEVFPEVAEDELIVNVTTTIKYKRFEFDSREAIYYEIGVPIKKIVSLNNILGIADEDNRTDYIIKGYVLSEVLE